MMRWDWVNDSSVEMRREQKNMRRVRRQRLMAEADAMMDEEEMEDVSGDNNAIAGGENDVVLGFDEVLNDDNMDEDSSDDSEDEDSSDDDDEESAASDEYAWGDHVSGRNAFIYNAVDSDSEEDEGDDSEDDVDQHEGRRRSAMVRARRSILAHFLRAH